jgi:hypothetical protein
MHEPESNKKNSWQSSRWAVPALIVIAGIINLANPHLYPWLRVFWFMLLPLVAARCGYFLYLQYRESRKR